MHVAREPLDWLRGWFPKQVMLKMSFKDEFGHREVEHTKNAIQSWGITKAWGLDNSWLSRG